MHQQAPRVGGQPLCLGVEKDDQALRVRGEGQVTFNNSHAMIDSAVSGLRIAYVLDDTVA